MSAFEQFLKAEVEVEECEAILSVLISHPSLSDLSSKDIGGCLGVLIDKVQRIDSHLHIMAKSLGD